MPRRLAQHGALAVALAIATFPTGVRAAEEPPPSPSPTPSPNPVAERIFARARDAWRTPTGVPYLRYGALVRYLHNGHVFDNWWDAYYRSRDGALSLEQLHDIAEEKHRLGGVPFSIFGFTFFDTNPDAEPIRLDAPRIDPVSSFGILTRGVLGRSTPRASRASPTPSVTPSSSATPAPQPSDAFREIAHVEASTRDYQIDLAGTDRVVGVPALHLTLTPLRDPDTNRLRDLWVDPSTYRTVQLNVQGLLGAKPYDGVEWTVRYVVLGGHNYVQQIVADAPLHFGLDTSVPKFEFDFVDYHFPSEVPQFTFDHSLVGPDRS
ncbi:MAG: hypothetical protein GIX03_13760 [Candidatus Eremiobacteraeota bacterium]|nr:hypothetical protein [Candidatus Eremiobacteraeota bacterium]MBC5804032.1 hypothetical protein [Candidatus Eremiobacteraeota bacterium]MBC5820431.1 hypothetical protein [Candidatus Eremiobacteraeota bacterium]